MLTAKPPDFIIKSDKVNRHIFPAGFFFQKGFYCADRNTEGILFWITVYTGGNQGKGDRPAAGTGYTFCRCKSYSIPASTCLRIFSQAFSKEICKTLFPKMGLPV